MIDYFLTQQAGRDRWGLASMLLLLTCLTLLVASPAAAQTPAITSVKPSPALIGNATLTINGSGFDNTAQVSVRGVSFTTKYVSPKKLVATGTLSSVAGNVVPLTVSLTGGATSPIYGLQLTSVKGPKATYLSAFRLLEQASWGPDPQSVADVQKQGVKNWVAAQIALPATTITTPPSGSGATYEKSQFLTNVMTAPDQLRQRVAFALSEIFVISDLKIDVTGLVPYYNLLAQDAFANFRQLMEDVTLSPSMGNYLDMVNNAKPASGALPNENYARELMQLFTIGTVELNNDGTEKLDAQGNTIPIYGETDIQQLARALTGWTYPGTAGHFWNPQNYVGSMISVDSYHDTTAKTFLGQTTPSGQTSTADLKAALDTIFNHPNVGPFIATRLIQQLVTSNPSPAYVKRIAKIFANDGKGTRGNLAAVVKAILLDSEARAGDQPKKAIKTSGHLREPLLYALAMLRALQATVGPNNSLAYYIDDMGELIFEPPSVFNYYSPLYHINDGALAAPEFQIMTPSTAVIRANYVDRTLRSNLGTDVTVDLSPFVALAANPSALLDAVSNAFFGGAMPDSMRSTITTALAAEPSKTLQARYALYLAASSAFYQVEH